MCDAIWTVLGPTYVQLPQTPAQWLTKAKEFENRWDYPRCVGALDGKHVQIQVRQLSINVAYLKKMSHRFNSIHLQCPGNSGSIFYSYKKIFSIVLFALVDAKCRVSCKKVQLCTKFVPFNLTSQKYDSWLIRISYILLTVPICRHWM